MGHQIQAIVAPAEMAPLIREAWPELPSLDINDGLALFPVSSELIDDRVPPSTPDESAPNQFMQLTPGFYDLLQQLSDGGSLAYIETDYFGGKGGQGAVVFKNGNAVMLPT